MYLKKGKTWCPEPKYLQKFLKKNHEKTFRNIVNKLGYLVTCNTGFSQANHIGLFEFSCTITFWASRLGGSRLAVLNKFVLVHDIFFFHMAMD